MISGEQPEDYSEEPEHMAVLEELHRRITYPYTEWH